MKLLKKIIKKVIKPALIIFAIIFITFVFYIYKLHFLAVEGNNIFAERCTKVNPPLISYKNSFLKMADMFNNPSNYEAGSGAPVFEEYISGMRKYVAAENVWLNKQKTFINRWDFKIIEPEYIKQASEYQYKMYEGYRDEAKYMLDVYNAGGMTEEINTNFAEARARRQKYENLYFNLSDRASQIKDWRKVFASVPVPVECTPENTTIPSTEGSINWGGTPTPTPEPVDSDLVSFAQLSLRHILKDKYDWRNC